MKILISGGTGLIGKETTLECLRAGHEVWILSRNPNARVPSGAHLLVWDGKTLGDWGKDIGEMDAVVNLAGENLSKGLWTPARKRRIEESRVAAGRLLSEAVRRVSPRPRVFLQASAIGYYGAQGNAPLTETSPAGEDFLAKVCRKWEESSRSVEEVGVRRVILRTGLVLSRKGGALPLMILPVRLFAGGHLGSGDQGVSWIHVSDEAGAICFLLENDSASGAFNLTAPEPLSNDAFMRLAAHILHRPHWLHLPAQVMRLALGEMSTLMLEGQFVLPKRLIEAGYAFRFPDAQSALREVLAKPSPNAA